MQQRRRQQPVEKHRAPRLLRQRVIDNRVDRLDPAQRLGADTLQLRKRNRLAPDANALAHRVQVRRRERAHSKALCHQTRPHELAHAALALCARHVHERLVPQPDFPLQRPKESMPSPRALRHRQHVVPRVDHRLRQQPLHQRLRPHLSALLVRRHFPWRHTAGETLLAVSEPRRGTTRHYLESIASQVGARATTCCGAWRTILYLRAFLEVLFFYCMFISLSN
mmetsp:Transcript_27205/g.83524  ORF Transcript_27205/g.83524 Transcript_27205/m.83524 type:complete len:224 (-) Transcript_27205:580-1251(-)